MTDSPHARQRIDAPGWTRRIRRHAGSMLAEGFFAGLATTASLHPRARPERHGIERIRDIPYLESGQPEHTLDVYRPIDQRRAARDGLGTPTPDLRPVVLYVHGGGFRILSKDTHWVMGLAFARRGYVVFNISYRLAPKHPFPAAFEDAARAYLWVVENAARFGGDPDRIALAGESAGGNLVTALALAASHAELSGAGTAYAAQIFERELRPRAVLPACGLLQASEPRRFLERWPQLNPFVLDRIEEASDAYLGADVKRRGRHDLADPLVALERYDKLHRPLAPFFAACGTRDPLLDDTERLERALRRHGARCDAAFYPGEIHAFHALIWRKQARRCWVDTYRFLDEHHPAPPA